MAWPGGKDGSGVAQRLINQIPPHDVFVSPFLGDCAILRKKLPAETYDLQPARIHQPRFFGANHTRVRVTLPG